jgi:Zn-dependent protease with chaperone function
VRTTVLPAIMVVLGVAIIVRTIAEGGDATAMGLVLGVLFCLAGGLRLWFERRAPR